MRWSREEEEFLKENWGNFIIMKEIIDLIQESYKVKIPKEKLKQEIEETYYFENTKEIDILIEDYYNNLTPKSIQEAKRIKTLLKTNTLKETANKLKLNEKKLKGKIKYLKKKGLL